VSFKPISGGTDEVCIPLDPSNLHTCYFKIHYGQDPSDDVKRFGARAWDTLSILKENFPSKVHLHQENLDSCRPFY